MPEKETAFLMTECTQESFAFADHFSRRVVANFDGARMTSDGGGLLLRRTERKIGLLQRVAACFTDGRDPTGSAPVAEMLAQRIYGLALGYEDLNDHEQLRHDPLLAVLAGKRELEEPLAGKSTLNRMELTPAGARRRPPIAIARSPTRRRSWTRCWWISWKGACDRAGPRSCSIWMSPTPRCTASRKRASSTATTASTVIAAYIFCGEHLLCARQRASDRDPSAGTLEEVERIVGQIRQRWPQVKIILRADSGFCRELLMAWCEAQHVDYVFGLARNERLEKEIAALLAAAQSQHRPTQQAARVFGELSYQTRSSWSRARRVVAKAGISTRAPTRASW